MLALLNGPFWRRRVAPHVFSLRSKTCRTGPDANNALGALTDLNSVRVAFHHQPHTREVRALLFALLAGQEPLGTGGAGLCALVTEDEPIPSLSGRKRTPRRARPVPGVSARDHI